MCSKTFKDMFKSSKSQTITTISITKNVSIKWKNKFTKINELVNIVVIQSSVMWVILRRNIPFVYPNRDCTLHLFLLRCCIKDHYCLHQEFVLNILNQWLGFFVHNNTIVHMFDTYGGHIFDIIATLVHFLHPTQSEQGCNKWRLQCYYLSYELESLKIKKHGTKMTYL